ncbi:cell division protein FtsB [Gammaproteobacteria bacterium AB-CW1]|uniref:Cell division protein FtsB n=1 Tax=Natronospira elongata TaxID=3110268 RepID=A0AAP6JCK4_9GAMM|nr:cell division protein FtsB [Gammaproteobacteria bacterium AB-CW1]
MRIVLAVLLLLLLVLQYQLWAGRGGVPELWNLRQQIETQEEENERLRARNEALEAEVDNLREGLEAIEERARSELGLVREGEVFFEVIELDRAFEEESDGEEGDNGE